MTELTINPAAGVSAAALYEAARDATAAHLDLDRAAAGAKVAALLPELAAMAARPGPARAAAGADRRAAGQAAHDLLVKLLDLERAAGGDVEAAAHTPAAQKLYALYLAGLRA